MLQLCFSVSVCLSVCWLGLLFVFSCVEMGEGQLGSPTAMVSLGLGELPDIEMSESLT